MQVPSPFFLQLCIHYIQTHEKFSPSTCNSCGRSNIQTQMSLAYGWCMSIQMQEAENGQDSTPYRQDPLIKISLLQYLKTNQMKW